MKRRRHRQGQAALGAGRLEQLARFFDAGLGTRDDGLLGIVEVHRLDHFALPEPSPANQNRQPLPFPDIYSSLQTDEKLLGELVAARLDKENALIRDMLMSLFGSEDDTNTITVMLRGRRNALRRMQEDSHQAKLTSILPPTASMPSALYAPEQLFK